MAYAYVQSASNSSPGAPVTSVAVTYGSHVTAGNKLIAYIWAKDTTAAFTIASVQDGTNNWVQKAVASQGTGGSYFTAMWWYAIDVTSSTLGGTSPTVTVTFSNTTALTAAIVVQEISGLVAGDVGTIITGGGGGTGTNPNGPAGNWRLLFNDDFPGTTLNTTIWQALNGGTINNVTLSAANVQVANSNCILTLSSTSTGGAITTGGHSWPGPNLYSFAVGDCCEARIMYPGPNSTTMYNWPAWWASGANWPSSGEEDIAEVLHGSGHLSVNYHGTTNSVNGPQPAGNWANSYHVYTCVRSASSFTVWWDGVQVYTHASGDNGTPQALLFNVGYNNILTNLTATGPTSRVYCDYVRLWTPA